MPPTILLQRLANPNVAFNAVDQPVCHRGLRRHASRIANPNAATRRYGVVNDARQYYYKGPNPNCVTNPNQRYSYGRNEPYAAGATRPSRPGPRTQPEPVAATGPRAPANANLPTTTFFAVNNPGRPPRAASPTTGSSTWTGRSSAPWSWLNVSGFKPHELTQQFFDVNNKPTPTSPRGRTRAAPPAFTACWSSSRREPDAGPRRRRPHPRQDQHQHHRPQRQGGLRRPCATPSRAILSTPATDAVIRRLILRYGSATATRRHAFWGMAQGAYPPATRSSLTRASLKRC